MSHVTAIFDSAIFRMLNRKDRHIRRLRALCAARGERIEKLEHHAYASACLQSEQVHYGRQVARRILRWLGEAHERADELENHMDSLMIAEYEARIAELIDMYRKLHASFMTQQELLDRQAAENAALRERVAEVETAHKTLADAGIFWVNEVAALREQLAQSRLERVPDGDYASAGADLYRNMLTVRGQFVRVASEDGRGHGFLLPDGWALYRTQEGGENG